MADVPRRRAAGPRRGGGGELGGGPAGRPPDRASGGGQLGPWCRDARVVTTTVLTTTGGTVWGAAHRAIDFFEAMAAELGMTRPGVRVSTVSAERCRAGGRWRGAAARRRAARSGGVSL
jgi:hypothetical protein